MIWENCIPIHCSDHSESSIFAFPSSVGCHYKRISLPGRSQNRLISLSKNLKDVEVMYDSFWHVILDTWLCMWSIDCKTTLFVDQWARAAKTLWRMAAVCTVFIPKCVNLFKCRFSTLCANIWALHCGFGESLVCGLVLIKNQAISLMYTNSPTGNGNYFSFFSIIKSVHLGVVKDVCWTAVKLLKP